MVPRRKVAGWTIGLAAAAAGLVTIVREDIRLGRLGYALTSSLPTLVVLLTGAIGVWLVYIGWPRRVGRGLFCKRCGYYQEDRGKITPSCPECGAAWRWIGNSKVGRPVGSLRLLGVGLLVCLLATSFNMVRSTAPWVMLRLMPDDVLLSQLALLPDDALVDGWAELARRKIPVARLDELAGSLLRKKARDGYLSSPAERVLFEAAMSPTAAPELARQYFGSLLRAELATPERAIQGRSLTITSLAEFQGRAMVLSDEPRVIVLSALFLGDDPEPVQTWEWEVQPDTADTQRRKLEHRVAETTAGTLLVRQRFWLVVGPPGEDPVGWSNGLPKLPGMMGIKDQFENRAEIQVGPRPILPAGRR